MRTALTRIVSWSHELLAEVLTPGGRGVDLTAGNGHDTLILSQLVGERGQVLAFDIQAQALQATEKRLLAAGCEVAWCETPAEPIPASGVTLVAASHAELGHYLDVPIQGAIANLGYLPGSDRSLITRPETTLAALQQTCRLLAPGGRLAVVVYPGHQGGPEEADLVDRFFAALPQREFEVLCMAVTNRPEAPYLQVAEKRKLQDEEITGR